MSPELSGELALLLDELQDEITNGIDTADPEKNRNDLIKKVQSEKMHFLEKI